MLLAGGVGSRGASIPKQLIKIAGETMEHTLRLFEAHPDVDEIFMLMAPGHPDAVRAMAGNGGYTKVRHLLEGGDTRSATIVRAIAAVGDGDCKCCFTTRSAPVTPRIVAECFAALDLLRRRCRDPLRRHHHRGRRRQHDHSIPRGPGCAVVRRRRASAPR